MKDQISRIVWKNFISPVGEITLASYGNALCLAIWYSEKKRERTERKIAKVLNADFIEGTSPVIEESMEQLHEYFRGERTTFTVPLLLTGTEFQKSVWNVLLQIPYGETLSYLEQAKRIGKAKAVRAVASANGANPIAILVPCHRVIGSNGTLTGYAGGLDVKQALLELENKIL